MSMEIKSEVSEFEGNTLDEAINKAVLKLGVPKNKLNIKIVCEENAGFLVCKGPRTLRLR